MSFIENCNKKIMLKDDKDIVIKTIDYNYLDDPFYDCYYRLSGRDFEIYKNLMLLFNKGVTKVTIEIKK